MTFCYFYYHVIAEYSGCCRISILIVLLVLLHFRALPYTPCKSSYVFRISSLRKNFYPEIKQTLTLLLLCPTHHFKVICLFTLPDLLLDSFGLDCASPFWIH